VSDLGMTLLSAAQTDEPARPGGRATRSQSPG
jgi:hypothetical protein